MIPWGAIATEAGVLCVFLLGLGISRLFRRRWHPTEIMTMYALGLLFEVLTAYMWEYHNIILVFPFLIADDISATFPLGWAGLIMTVTSLVERLWGRWRIKGWWRRHLILMSAWLVIGDVTETIFHNAGMFEYVRDEHTRINFVLGQFKPLPPTVVLLGYGFLQPFVTWFFLWMERGLSARKGR